MSKDKPTIQEVKSRIASHLASWELNLESQPPGRCPLGVDAITLARVAGLGEENGAPDGRRAGRILGRMVACGIIEVTGYYRPASPGSRPVKCYAPSGFVARWKTRHNLI